MSLDDVVEDYEPLEPKTDSWWSRYANWDKGLELVCVLLMATASLAAAWSGFQAASWGGEMSESYSVASGLRMESGQAANVANQLTLLNIEMFNNWAEARIDGNAQLEEFYRNRFSGELETATVAWLATEPFTNPDAPTSPFVMVEYSRPETVRAAELAEQANATFAAGTEAGETGDEYVFSTVFLAMVLFFAGLAAKLNWFLPRVLSAGMASVMLVVGLYWIVDLPVA
jgi:hypothetical protein